MNFRILMIVTAVSTFLFGTGFIFAPAQLGAIYGMASSPISNLALRLYATALIGLGVLAWSIRQSRDSALQKPVLLALFVTDLGGFLFMLFAQLAGLMNTLGWSVVVLLLLLSAAYAYLRLARQPA